MRSFTNPWPLHFSGTVQRRNPGGLSARLCGWLGWDPALVRVESELLYAAEAVDDDDWSGMVILESDAGGGFEVLADDTLVAVE